MAIFFESIKGFPIYDYPFISVKKKLVMNGDVEIDAFNIRHEGAFIYINFISRKFWEEPVKMKHLNFYKINGINGKVTESNADAVIAEAERKAREMLIKAGFFAKN